jgi:PAS domain S-box-containing protein
MKKQIIIVLVIWLSIVGSYLCWNLIDAQREHEKIAFEMGRAFYQQMVLTRSWNAQHGGVYVPVTATSPPNPYLDDPLRDITADNGIRLTKINPAYMTRQIAEIAAREKGVQFHITSLNPIRPANKAVDWEERWLKIFEQGEKEQGEFIHDGTDTVFRYMAPLFVKTPCLKCHAKQGYKEGDIRGGISVTIPGLSQAANTVLLIGYGVAAACGVIFILTGGILLERKRQLLEESNSKLQEKLQLISGQHELLNKQHGELKRHEGEIERLHLLLDNIINSMPSVLVGVDPDGRVIQWNFAAQHVTGISPAEARGQKLAEVFPALVNYLDTIRQAIRERRIKTDPKIATEHGGETRYSDVTVYPLITNGIDGAVIRVDDITDQVQVELEKAKLFVQLQQAQKMEAIGTLAGGIAHDFNNILTPIYGYTELARTRLSAENSAAAELGEVLKAAGRAMELVKQILTYSRQTPHEPQPLEIQLIVKEALKLLRSSIPTTIEINQQIEPGLGTVLADPTQIHQVLMNLCTNAYHAMRETGGVLAIRLTAVDLDRTDAKVAGLDLSPGPYLKLEVSDTGHGMDRATRERIFEPYFTTKKKGEGTGMGLAVAHGIVKNHGGYIAVYSEPGQGTTFNVYLPRILAATVPVVAESATPLRRGNKERILIVDDDKTIVQLEQQILEGLDYQVTASSDSQEALETFCAGPADFDLVITNMTMPRLTGIELAQRLLVVREDIPIILCTGFSELVNEEKAKALGIREYVMKPVVRQELARVVRKALDGK